MVIVAECLEFRHLAIIKAVFGFETLGLIVACPESIGFTPEFLKGEIPLSPQARTLMDSSDVRSGRSTPIISIQDGHQPNSRGLYTHYKDFRH